MSDRFAPSADPAAGVEDVARKWVAEGRSDAWIAHQLECSVMEWRFRRRGSALASARLLEERRRRRDRRDAREQAYREWVCGGPLVDALRPVIGGGTDAEHEARVYAEFAERQRRVAVELDLLARDFARRCALPRLAQALMVSEWLDLNASLTRRLGPLGPQAMHSTSATTARRHTPFGPIPQL